MRREWVAYPNGRKVFFDYDPPGSRANYLNRLDAIRDDDTGSAGITLAKYSYLGLGTIVIEEFQRPDVKGRFVARDPIRYAAGENNIYRYVHGNPLISGGPLGLDTARFAHHDLP